MGDVQDITREQLLEKARTATIDRARLVVPELGGAIYVRGMSGRERDRFEEDIRIKKGKRAGQADLRNFRARMAAKVIVDKDGNRLLNDSEEDIAVLSKLGASVLDRIISKCQELSGTSDEDAENLGNDSASPTAS